MSACRSCDAIQQYQQMQGLGQARQLPVYPIPQQVNPQLVYVVVGAAVAVVGLSVLFYVSRKRGNK